MDRPGPLRLLVLLTVGILAVSCASIFIRLAAAPSLAVAALRLSWATLLLTPLVLAAPVRELAPLARRDWCLLLLSGAALALHFALWIASLSYTSVASSVLLVDTTPFFVGLASHWVLSRPCRRRFWIGLGVAFLGCLAIFHGDWHRSQNSMKGNLLAVGGAVAAAIYLMVGARARQKLSLLAYVWPVYGSSALVLLTSCVIAGTPLRGYSGQTHFFVFLLGLVPQCIGHTTYNWSLRWLSPALVALIGLAEPIAASFLAWIILHEGLTAAKLIGGAIILLGIWMGTVTKMTNDG